MLISDYFVDMVESSEADVTVSRLAAALLNKRPLTHSTVNSTVGPLITLHHTAVPTLLTDAIVGLWVSQF